MPAPAASAAALEVLLNRHLGREPAVAGGLKRLAGRVLGLKIAGLGWEYCLEFHPTGVRVMRPGVDPAPAAHATVTGTPVQFARLGAEMARALAEGQASGPAGIGGLAVEGDADLLYQFNKLVAQAGFDPAEWLSPALGPLGAEYAVAGLKALAGFGGRLGRALTVSTAEYFREETRDLASATEAERFGKGVEKLRDDAERLEARVARLERRLKTQVPGAA